MRTEFSYWANLVVNLSGFSLLIPILIGFVNYKRHGKVSRVVTFFVLISGIYEFIAGKLAESGVENLKMITPWVVIETLFVCTIYKTVLTGNWKGVIKYLLIALAIIGVIDIVFYGDSDTYSSLLRSTECGVFIVLSIVYFYQLLEDLRAPSLSNEPMVWFNTAFLIYFAGNLFFFVASGTLGQTESFGDNEYDILLKLYTIHAVIIIFRNSLIARGLWIRNVK